MDLNRFIPDKFLVGLIQGVLIPAVIVTVFLLIQINDWYAEMIKSKAFIDLFVKLLSLASLPNLGLFYLYINRLKYRGGKGIIVATFVYAIIIFVVKFTL
ncbi:MAG: hypothetical protein N4A72_12240 [Bacteroidales bacterium]|jgi:hypothetical protein|nr:hypothetical protein [Bacteroidales bacterium]